MKRMYLVEWLALLFAGAMWLLAHAPAPTDHDPYTGEAINTEQGESSIRGTE